MRQSFTLAHHFTFSLYLFCSLPLLLWLSSLRHAKVKCLMSLFWCFWLVLAVGFEAETGRGIWADHWQDLWLILWAFTLLVALLTFFCIEKAKSKASSFRSFVPCVWQSWSDLDIGHHRTFHPGDWERMNTRDTQEFGSPGLVSTAFHIIWHHPNLFTSGDSQIPKNI